jgi:transketolase
MLRPKDHSRIPDEVLAHFRQGIGARGSKLHEAWDEEFADYRREQPDEAKELDMTAAGQLVRRLMPWWR